MEPGVSQFRGIEIDVAKLSKLLGVPVVATVGVHRGGADPLQLYISIAGVCYFYLSNQHTLTAIFGRDLKARKAVAIPAERRAALEALLVPGLGL